MLNILPPERIAETLALPVKEAQVFMQKLAATPEAATEIIRSLPPEVQARVAEALPRLIPALATTAARQEAGSTPQPAATPAPLQSPAPTEASQTAPVRQQVSSAVPSLPPSLPHAETAPAPPVQGEFAPQQGNVTRESAPQAETPKTAATRSPAPASVTAPQENARPQNLGAQEHVPQRQALASADAPVAKTRTTETPLPPPLPQGAPPAPVADTPVEDNILHVLRALVSVKTAVKPELASPQHTPSAPPTTTEATAAPASRTPVASLPSSSPPPATQKTPQPHVQDASPASRARAVSAPPPPSAPEAPPVKTTVPAIVSKSLGVLLPLIERLSPQPQPGASPAPAREDAALPMPKNMFHLRVVEIAPPQAGQTARSARFPVAPAPVPAAASTPYAVQTPIADDIIPQVSARAPTPQPVEVRGVVESLTQNGHPIIRSDDGQHFVLQKPAQVPVGSRVTLEATPMTAQEALNHVTNVPAKPASGGTTTPAPLDPLTDRTWPALDAVLQAAPPVVAQGVRATLPAPAQNLTPAALLFLAALRLGDVANWLGQDVLKTLQSSGRRDLADRLKGDFTRLSTQAQEPLPGGWKLISMPLLHDGAIGQAQIFVRRQDADGGGNGDKDDAKGKGAVTRFLLNISLNRMGDLQIDGLVQKKSLDLVLRTEAPLPGDARQEIRRRFTDATEQTGMQGGVSFQARREGWVTVGAEGRGGTLA